MNTKEEALKSALETLIEAVCNYDHLFEVRELLKVNKERFQQLELEIKLPKHKEYLLWN